MFIVWKYFQKKYIISNILCSCDLLKPLHIYQQMFLVLQLFNMSACILDMVDMVKNNQEPPWIQIFKRDAEKEDSLFGTPIPHKKKEKYSV